MQYRFLRRLLAVLGLALIAVSLTGCSSSSGYYRVRRGDTLGRIAQRHGANAKDLARLNRLSKPNALAVGQRLRVKPSGRRRAPVRTAHTPPPRSAQVLSNLPSSITNIPASVSFAWRWPAQGAIIRGFDGINNKGINIAGKGGDPVYAAADGTVVYAGNGLRGYGNLLIIRHPADFLTAYAHNRRLCIPEGQNVKRGQLIAQMGNTDSTDVMLHFEVRYKGRSLDPLRYLPAR
ncbi:peptidoglycan DD-metalloendopeptidase family protein [Mycoavidus sp. HKI]|uniref:peptidoglycan DD-metalloendopeptidase family protein n=1 Tax=Mycoavidus sp. HKI TaxID=2840467 RepID=UPI001CC02BC9|nr:peptidoglycan DD-metalloendopeptidase family protein [Mycoavidus sp. HKI]UAW64854.1 peptidoglycan DD-metalloendopeptidase family protein [Mycoavidus sp. HKI]